ncbi:MAG: response regulator transcription factor [Clostridia bacterium]|nr:response regulator transcription factor [Clostridia bacterium]
MIDTIEINETIETGTKEEVESIQESLVMEVCEAYGRPYTDGDKEKPSMRSIAEQFGISPMKVKKILVTGGLFQTEMSDEIQRLYARGLSVKQIAELKNTSVANVNTYLPYEKVIYNLDVRNEEAVNMLKWRRKQAERVVGRPEKALQNLFEQTVEAFSKIYDRKLNVQLFACEADDGPSTLIYLLRTKGYQANLPDGMVLEEYIRNMDSHIFMYGADDEGHEVDGILIRADKPGLKEMILRSLAEIYCRRYEVDGGFFYRDYCENLDDKIEREIMRTGYNIWSTYIAERMIDKVLDRTWETDDEAMQEDVYDSIWHPGSAAFVLLNTVGRDGTFPYAGLRGAVSSHGDNIGIDPEFIHRLGHVFLIEQAEIKLKLLRERIKN